MPSMLDLGKPKHIHFIGIGGISMSALAMIMLNRGWTVSGSDLRESNLTDRLQNAGATITFTHSAENVHGADVIVYTSAVKPDNPELVRAKELGIPIYARAELLGDLIAEATRGIAIAGSHGKTTTTAMLGVMLDLAGCNPTVLVGGELESLNGNVKVGNGNFLVAEACEYFDNFLSLKPNIGVILNIDADHLDYFKDIEQIKRTFRSFAELIPEDGTLVACVDDANVRSILPGLGCPVVSYGLESSADWTVADLQLEAGGSTFTAVHHGQPQASVKLRVPGGHNVQNALAAIAVGHLAGLAPAVMAEKLGEYRGTHRRFDYQGECNGAAIYDDYAHHPTEIKATLAAGRTYRPKRLICVFQPHTYTRTKALMREFAQAFEEADLVIVTDIYAAREKDTYGVNSAQLAEQMQAVHPNAQYIGSLQQAAEYLRQELRPGDLLFTMGAGDVYRVAEMLLKG
ncbi:MAG: UDP-N-acetylmuramate--L-alanine ligase [Bacillota bacterium]|jgi:UDP-N-acetylmuramate--alanine ligase